MSDVAQIGQSPHCLRIVLAGGSGQVGTLLARHFQTRGHAVTVLSRRPSPAPWQVVAWDAATLGDWTRSLEGADLLVNLCGRSVNCRYTQDNRREILESRTRPTILLGQAISGMANPPRVWMNASTAAIYRHSTDRPMDEENGELGGNQAGVPAAWHFSHQVGKAWEEAFFQAETPRTRKAALRTAIVMSPDADGIFDTLLGLVRYGLGGRAGSGKQIVSWIHEYDFVRAIEFLATREQICGVVNLTSPNSVPNEEFMRILREAWGISFGLPSPAWLLEIGTFFLRTEPELVLKSRWSFPRKLLDSRFQFEFPDWAHAARDLVMRWRNPALHAVVETETA